MSERHLLPAVLALALLAGCGGDTTKPGDSATPGTTASYPDAPVVLISIDTLRSDHLPAYGYDAVETPAIDAFRADAVLYERAYSQCPLTLPSHASLFTGLLPTEHGVRDNVGYRLETAGVPFLPRQLKDKGYATGAAVSAYILRADTGMGDGYDFYEDSFNLRGGAALGENQRPGIETVRRAVGWLDSVHKESVVEEKPFYLFVHLYDPHTPYDPPEPYASRYPGRPYDGEIALADAAVGELIDALKRLGVYERSLVVLFSDHGEGLGDHGEEEHGILLYRESVQVPLMVKLPNNERAGTSVAAPASLTDVRPTVASLVGATDEEPVLLNLDGASPRPIYTETYYPRFHLGWSDLLSLIEGDLQYIEGPDPELYDLVADPAQKTNILRERRSEYAALRDQLNDLRRAPEAPTEADPETAARLESLGYLSGSATVAEGPLPDPKASLHLLPKLTEAARMQNDKKYAEAARLLREALKETPNSVDAWESLGLCLHHLQRYDEAEEAFKKALELSRGADHIALGLGRLYLEMGRLDDAEAHARLALRTNPANAHRDLARIALAADDLDAAEAEARASLEANDNAVAPYLVLTQVMIRREDLAAARESMTKAEQLQGKRQDVETPFGFHFTRGELLAYEGKNAEAAQAFYEEIRVNPDDPRAYCRLAVVYMIEQRPRDAVNVLRKMVTDNPTPVAYAAAVETLRILGDPIGAQQLLRHAQGLFPGHPKLTELNLRR